MGTTIDESIDWIKKTILDMRRTQICTLDRLSLETAIDTMQKYKKIEHIIKSEKIPYKLDLIEKVIEDGNDE